MKYVFISAFVLVQFAFTFEARAEKKLRRGLASSQGTITGTIEGAKRQDYKSPEVIGMAIHGDLAKELYQHLKVKPQTLPSVDGEFQLKDAPGIQCNLKTGTQDYDCYIDVGPKGI